MRSAFLFKVTSLIFAVMIVTLGAAHSEQSQSEMEQAMSRMPRQKPGLYEMTSTMLSSNVDYSQITDVMKPEIGKPEVSKHCVSAENANVDPRDNLADGFCSYKHFIVDGTKVDFDMTCGAVGEDVRHVQSVSTVNPDSSESRERVEHTLAGETESTVEEFATTMKWLSECSGENGQ